MSVITFYSYKGGVGRTMALANVAVLLARTHRVLVVDWDLQAPGIERFFAELHIEPEGIGLLPLLTRVASGHRPDYREYISQVAAVDDKLAFGLLHSGRGSDPGYYHKLEHFNWTGFYKQGGGDYLERLREQCLSDYDFVLIDSRTGLSDAGGVCTIQMPDIVVAVFTPTRQSLYGVRDVMRLAQAARQRLAYDRSALSVVPVPSRVDRTQSSYGEWRELFAKEMAEFLAAWLPRSADRAVVLDRLAIDHAHEVSHGERLVTFPGGDTSVLSTAYDRLATLLASDLEDLTPIVEVSPRSLPVSMGRSRFDAVAEELAEEIVEASPRSLPVSMDPTAHTIGHTPVLESTRSLTSTESDSPKYLYDVFVSYPRNERITRWLHEQFVPALQAALRDQLGRMPEIFVDNAEIAVADQWVETQRLALARSRAMLAVLTPSYFQSSWCMAEFETFVRRSYVVNKVLLVSIRYSQILSWPDIALNHPTFNFTEYAIAGKGSRRPHAMAGSSNRFAR
ncbi:MAG TPA: TIR domain-containing protein [Kofleriaceae bacterium]|jgi:MinD-like ATPase involved in chromosome partitioning or flagellar assembly|nr:TIR domain-containing protein [Kofleriaceae bacterium]